MRAFTAATVQSAPLPGPLTRDVALANAARVAELVGRCADATGAELVVAPETATTGFVTGLDAQGLRQVLRHAGNGLLQPFQEAARSRDAHVVVGSYELGDDGQAMHNSSFLIGPDGRVLARYRKVHLWSAEDIRCGGWVTAGDDAVVADTVLGRIGMIICFDGDYPELARVEAVAGAEVIVRPSALLRSADIWELTCRARAYDNHVYVIGANATGTDPGGCHYFGNSLIVSPTAHVLARSASHESWLSARLDPAEAMAALTPGSSVPHGFDHLADRNLDFIGRNLDNLRRSAKTPFAHG